MSEQDLMDLPQKLKDQFSLDTRAISQNTESFIKEAYPFYFSSSDMTDCIIEEKSDHILEAMSFYKVTDCTIENANDVFAYLNEKIRKFLIATYSIGVSICYGIVGRNGNNSIILGIDPLNTNEDKRNVLTTITRGLLPGINLIEFRHSPYTEKDIHCGIISGVPVLKIGDEKQKFDCAPLLRSLNGQNYMLLIMAKPVRFSETEAKISNLMKIKDSCAIISKRNVSLQRSQTHSEGEDHGSSDTHTEGTSNTKSKTTNKGLSFILNGSHSKTKSRTDNKSDSHAESYNKSVSDAITNGGALAVDIQNSFALELIELVDKAIHRLMSGKNVGIWQTSIAISASSETSFQLLQGCLNSEIAKTVPDSLPSRTIIASEKSLNEGNKSLVMPKNMLNINEETKDGLCTFINTDELAFLCSLPDKSVPGFELRIGKYYPTTITLSDTDNKEKICLGQVSDCGNILNNISFDLSLADLNKHTFVCGITGSGKTNTVKHILREVKKPFFVIECAKKEYRGLKIAGNKMVTTYTLGRPEINCIKINPFYILPGTSPQLHIDYLKDLFNASFSFYGPMPYIVEKCLHNIYEKRGWNLAMGYHPALVNTKSTLSLFDKEYIEKQYEKEEHKFFFPTMCDLKDEVESYIKYHLDYKGEVADNIRTAVLARLESLCVGVKGYMFNTNDFIDFDKMLEENVVFELEGLADDADKAFTVGLFIIYLNEFRMIETENSNSQTKLRHLLIIEEAHRLLKNVSTERVNEDMGNPKGKAIEHFTNMLAEMRSYGQGVIIAEQIPSKIAPDVIKNASNKIVHRIVSKDDQEFVANMIGIKDDDAIFLGDQKTGFALCHCEGMSAPVSVKMPVLERNTIKDSDLRQGNLQKQDFAVLVSAIRPYISKHMDDITVKFLNTVLTFDEAEIKRGIKLVNEKARKTLKIHSPHLLNYTDVNKAIARVIAENIIRYLGTGIYYSDNIPTDTFSNIVKAFNAPYDEPIIAMVGKFKEIGDKNNKLKHCISELTIDYIKRNKEVKKDLHKLVQSYFLSVRKETVNELIEFIKKRVRAMQ